MAITDWPVDDRPREKLLAKGSEALSDAELVAIFLRTGVRGRSAVDLAREALARFGSLSGLFAAEAGALTAVSGLGTAKYAQLQAVLEMARRALITAGPTFEPIDAVRGITNRSSGKMGYAIARAALNAGARVTLISGPVSLAPPAGADVAQDTTAVDMFEAVKRNAARADIYIGVAAVADYRVDKPRRHKIKKTDSKQLDLKLVPNPDILAWMAARPNPPFCVGFAAESRNLDAYADEKRRRKKVPLMVANLAQEAIGSDDNEVTLLDDKGAHKLPRAPKEAVARQLVAHIARLYGSRKKANR